MSKGLFSSTSDSTYTYSEYSQSATKSKNSLLDKTEMRRLEMEQEMFDRSNKQLMCLDAAPTVHAYLSSSKNRTEAVVRHNGDHLDPPSIIHQGTLHRRNLLHSAAMHGRDEALSEILDSVDMAEEEYANEYKNARGLKNKKAIPRAIPIGVCVNVTDGHGDTALIMSARGGHFECARLLLAKGADPNVQNKSLHSAMHCAALGNEKEMLELLFHHGANPTLKTFTKYTPAHLARKQGHLRTAIWLEEAEDEWMRRNPPRKRRTRGLFIECTCSYCQPLKEKNGNRDDPTLAIVGAQRKVDPSNQYTLQHDVETRYLILQADRRAKLALKKKDE